MIDFKNTIIKLHEKFPEWDLDTLIEVIKAIEEVTTITYPQTTYPQITYPSTTPIPKDINKVWC